MDGVQKTEDVQAFVAVVRHGSLILAAEALQVSQPAITRRIQSLEETLGVELLERHTKPLKPSPAGLAIYDQCRQILREMQVLKSMVAHTAVPSGVLRLGAPFIINGSPLVQSILGVKQHYPNLRVQVTPGWSSTLISRVENGELDAALAVQPQISTLPPSVTGELLADLEMCVVAPLGEFEERPYHLREIYSRGWVLNPRECGMRSSLEAALTSQSLPLTLNVDVLNSDMQLELVAAGLGLGLVPRHLLELNPHRARLGIIELADFKLNNRIWMVTPVIQSGLHAAIEEVAETIKKEFSPRT
ncbi:LysR family transcriptional regulator [Pseudomonas sp. LRF_L74]|uniref:LysR family transcriptional regulator n=1 Tax=Pseudomonas sp. LRF_L74 TaxID=3369422 RepID=UPI003F5DD0C7